MRARKERFPRVELDRRERQAECCLDNNGSDRQTAQDADAVEMAGYAGKVFLQHQQVPNAHLPPIRLPVLSTTRVYWEKGI